MDILTIIREFNSLMASAIQGPNCIDEKICHGDCCHIHIDIPKILAEYYIDNKLATKDDFIRGEIFAFALAVRPENSKCVFYDKQLNGCLLHSSGMKPPQCWIYPTGFNNEIGEEKQFADDGTIKCKRSSGWWVKDTDKTKKAHQLLQDYIKYSEHELLEENSQSKIKERFNSLRVSFSKTAPKKIAGLVDQWDHFSPLYAEGTCLKLKRYCDRINHKDQQCIFLECNKVCDDVLNHLVEDLEKEIIEYIKKNGPKQTYSFYDLWK